MVRTILTPNNTHIELDIPVEYVGKPLEITYQTINESAMQNPSKKSMKDFLGILSDKSAEELREHIQKTRDEWQRDI